MEKLIVSEKDLSLSENGMLNKNQLQHLLKVTPAKYIKERPAKGGGKWKYVSGGYVKKVLNLMFGWDWSFEIMEQQILYGEAIVKGRLSCRVNGREIVKMQFGNKDIMYKKLQEGETERVPLSIGNDLKAAATDALKKCAAEIGIAADIYNPEEFREVQVESVESSDDQLSRIISLRDQFEQFIETEKLKAIDLVIDNKVVNSYSKFLRDLESIQKEMQS
jgi:recombination DNA repair RAD52 pathway protein